MTADVAVTNVEKPVNNLHLARKIAYALTIAVREQAAAETVAEG